MQKITLAALTVLFLLPSAVSANSGGPDVYGYIWKDSNEPGGPTYNWIDISSYPTVQTVSGLTDDNAAPGMVNIGFPFHYYWSDYTQVKVGSNGWLSFNNVSNIASCFPLIPTQGGAGDNILAAFMTDLIYTGVGNPAVVQCWSNNIDSFIVSYNNTPWWTPNAPGWIGSNTFQIILCGSDSSITFQYGDMDPASFVNNGACAADIEIGIENITGNIGLEAINEAVPADNYTIRFYYPPVVTFTVPDVTPAWNGNIDNRGFFAVSGTAVSLVTNLENVGNANITNAITAGCTILDVAQSSIFTTTGTVPSLNSGDDTTLTFSPAWTPALAGQYTYRVATTNSQDINPSNNQIETEIGIVDLCAGAVQLTYATGGLPDGSLSWAGADSVSGGATYFRPPFYPFPIASLDYNIFMDTSTAIGFTSVIYADDGPGGSPGTILFSSFNAEASLINSAWNTINVSTAPVINSGGFYVVFLQDTSGATALGIETTGPYSRSNYEIINGSWAAYRDNNSNDLLIRVNSANVNPPAVAGFSSSIAASTGTFTDASTGGTVASWLWDFGDSQTSTQQNPVHYYAAIGTYTVCLTVTDSCGNVDSTCQTVVITILNLASQNSELNLITYPNPANEFIQLTFGAAVNDATIEILDQTGRLVMSQQVSGKNTELNISGLAVGMYTLHIVTEDGSSNQKFIRK